MIICYDKKTVKGSGRNDIILYITYSGLKADTWLFRVG